MSTPTRTVELLPLDELQTDPRNPKAHDEGTITSSIDRFGIVEAIVRDDRTGYIISGHGRRSALTAMRDRGDNPPEGVHVDPDGIWRVPVITGWASRSDSEARAALIALNRTTELGGWVDDELLGLLGELAEVDNGLDGVGYYADDIEALRGKVADLGDAFDDLHFGEEESFNQGRAATDSIEVSCPECGHSFEV